MDAKERRKLENELAAMGFDRLTETEQCDVWAGMISSFPGDKHEFFRDLLNECETSKRTEMYNALAPRLNFKPLALDQYQAQIALKAGQLVSQGRMDVEGQSPHSIEIGGHRLPVVRQADADYAVARVTCALCPATAKFVAPTAVTAMIEARKAGWVRDKGMNKEICPECAAEQASQEIVTLSRREKLFVTDRRVKVN